MEAATPLPLTTVRVLGDRVVADGLQIVDECVVRLVSEADDPAKLLADAAAIGARVLDREQTAANAEYVKAEFERAARDLDREFVERARKVADRLDAKVDEVFGAESGQVVRLLDRHFGDESSVAVHHRVRTVLGEATKQLRDDLRRQLSADSDDNPLAAFHRVQIAVAKEQADRHANDVRALGEKLEAMRLELERMRGDKDKLEEVAAERERGTAKGRSYEELVAEAVEQLALPHGDDSDAVGDVKEASGKKGDVVVAIDGCHGPARGRIVFEAKNKRLSRPEALRELDAAKAERNADYAVLVVPAEDKVPARMLPLREYHGDKLVVTYDPDDGPLALQVAYALARARVVMTRGGGDGVDVDAVRDTADRALQAMADVLRIKQQLTASKSSIDKAADIVDAMAATVRAHLAEIAALLEAAED